MGLCTSKKNQNFGRLGSNRSATTADLKDFRFATSNDFKIDLLKKNCKPPPNIKSPYPINEIDQYLNDVIESPQNTKKQNGIINDHFTNLANGTIKMEILICGYIRQLLHECNKTKLIPYIILTTVKKTYFPQYVAIEIGASNESFYSTFRMSHLLSSSAAIHYNGAHDVCHVSTINDKVYCTDQEPRSFQCIDFFTQLKKQNEKQFIDIISYGISNKHLFISTIDPNTCEQHIFCCGTNTFGQCATGDDKSVSQWTKIKDFWSTNASNSILNVHTEKQRIKDIKCGLYHTIFLGSNGCVWSCGQNWVGQLGLGEDIRKVWRPQSVKFQQKDLTTITPMSSATNLSTAAATNLNKSFVGDCKMLLFEESVRIKSISCGDAHNLCLDENGELWVFGHMAIENNMKQHIFEAIKHPWFVERKRAREKEEDIGHVITKINCGSDHSVCCDSNGFCYLFGTNDKGQIGHKYFSVQYEPYIFQQSTDKDNKNKYVFENIKIIDVEAGQCHTVLLTSTNDLITFGSNYYKQCSTVIKNNIVCFGHILMRHQEIGITSDTYIERIIASANSTILIVNMAKKLKIIR